MRRCCSWLLPGCAACRPPPPRRRARRICSSSRGCRARSASHAITASGVRRWLDERDGAGRPEANAVWLAERADVHPRVRAVSTRRTSNVSCAPWRHAPAAADRVLILLFGHGSYQSGETRINLPGPDITGQELAALLTALRRAACRGRQRCQRQRRFHGRTWRRPTASSSRRRARAWSGTKRCSAGTSPRRSPAPTPTRTATAASRCWKRSSTHVARSSASTSAATACARSTPCSTAWATAAAPARRAGVSACAARRHVLHRHARGAAAARHRHAGAAPAVRGEGAARGGDCALRARRDAMNARDYEDALETLLVELSLNAQAIRRLEGGQ
jgi:hypothetical protein